ncbi:hypothetical protein ACOSQ4_005445 [Xanthoceras sorbifolium]
MLSVVASSSSSRRRRQDRLDHTLTYAVNAFLGPDIGSFSECFGSFFFSSSSALADAIHDPVYYFLIHFLGCPFQRGNASYWSQLVQYLALCLCFFVCFGCLVLKMLIKRITGYLEIILQLHFLKYQDFLRNVSI